MNTPRGRAIRDARTTADCAAVVLTSSRATVAQVRDAIGDLGEIVAVSTVRELLDHLRARSTSVALVESAGDAMHSPAGAIGIVRAGFPSLPIIACCGAMSAGAYSVAEVVRAGASEVLFEGIDRSCAVLRAVCCHARRAALAQHISEEISPLLPFAARSLLRSAIANASVDGSAEGAAGELGVDRKTLFNWMRSAGAPPPREFLTWVRLVIAAGMLEDPERSAESVALELNFASGTALRNMIRRYAGVTTAELRDRGGASWLLERFKERFAPPSRHGAGEAESEPAIPGAHRRVHS